MPLGTEAAKLDRDLFRHASNLVLLKVRSAEVVSVKQLSEDIVECLITVPGAGDRRDAYTALVCRTSGSVQFIGNWDVL